MEEQIYRKAAEIKDEINLNQRVVDEIDYKIEKLKKIAEDKHGCNFRIEPPTDTYAPFVIYIKPIKNDLLKIFLKELETEKSIFEKDLKRLQEEFEKL